MTYKLVNKARRSKLTQPYSNLHVEKIAGGECITGIVATPHGFVRVHAEKIFFSLEFIHAGECYCLDQRVEAMPSKLTLSRRATKFAREVVAQKLDKTLLLE